MDLSDSRRAATRCGVRGGEPRPIGPPPITRIALPACCAHYPGGPKRVRLPASFPVPHGLPRYPDGSASASLLSRPAQASTYYGPLARSAAQGGLRHRAPARSLADRLSATRSNRLLSRWNLPPLATRAYGAHWAKALALAFESNRSVARLCPPPVLTSPRWATSGVQAPLRLRIWGSEVRILPGAP